MDKKEFGRRLRKMRKTAGLSMRDFGVLLGYSDKAVWTWEHGRSWIPSEAFFQYCKELGVDPCVVLRGTEETSEERITSSLERINKSLKELLVSLRKIKKGR